MRCNFKRQYDERGKCIANGPVLLQAVRTGLIAATVAALEVYFCTGTLDVEGRQSSTSTAVEHVYGAPGNSLALEVSEVYKDRAHDVAGMFVTAVYALLQGGPKPHG